jgi:hypothetical protein
VGQSGNPSLTNQTWFSGLRDNFNRGGKISLNLAFLNMNRLV